MLNIDIVITSKKNENEKAAIEFNGPSHYVRRNGENVESGRTKFKQRLLEGLGFTVLSINWGDWRRARETKTQEDFLRKLLN